MTPPVLEDFRNRTAGADPDEYYGLSHRSVSRRLEPSYEGNGRALFGRRDLPERFDVDEFGVGMSYGSEAAFHMCHFHSPLEGEVSVRDVETFPLPVSESEEEKRLTEEACSIQNRGFAAVGALEQTIWERSWLIRGMNDLMMDMMMDDPRAEVILDRMTAHSLQIAEMYARSGFDIICLGDDIGMQNTVMMSPDLWKKWIRPRLKNIIDAVDRVNPDCLIFYHSCGFVEPFIPELIDIGVDILNPFQPECMDVKKLHREYGRDLSFWGGIGTQTTFPFGSPGDVKQAARDLVDLWGSRGGLVLAPTHVVEPEVPWENLEAFREVLVDLNSAAG